MWEPLRSRPSRCRSAARNPVTGANREQVMRKACEAHAEPATAFLRLGTADRHCRGHTRNEREINGNMRDPDAYRHALR